MKDDAVIKDNEAVYLINEQTYLHLRENIEGIGYEVFEKESPLPVEEGQIPREVLGDSQRRIEAAREYYLAEYFDDPVVKIQNVAVTTLEKFRSGVRKRRTLDPHSLPDDDVRFIDPRYNELFRVPDGSMVQLKFPNGRQYSEKVEYLDDYHMRIGSAVQHICEFAERILYRGNLPTGKRSVPQPELLEQLYQKFNCAQPMDYHGHSLSVSDVILLNQAGKISAHYVDSIGFRELSGFQDKQERSSVLSQLKAKCDMPECNPTKCRKGRDDHAI